MPGLQQREHMGSLRPRAVSEHTNGEDRVGSGGRRRNTEWGALPVAVPGPARRYDDAGFERHVPRLQQPVVEVDS